MCVYYDNECTEVQNARLDNINLVVRFYISRFISSTDMSHTCTVIEYFSIFLQPPLPLLVSISTHKRSLFPRKRR